MEFSREDENVIKRVRNELQHSGFDSSLLIVNQGKVGAVMVNGQINMINVFKSLGTLGINAVEDQNVDTNMVGLSAKEQLIAAFLMGLDVEPKELANTLKYMINMNKE